MYQIPYSSGAGISPGDALPLRYSPSLQSACDKAKKDEESAELVYEANRHARFSRKGSFLWCTTHSLDDEAKKYADEESDPRYYNILVGGANAAGEGAEKAGGVVRDLALEALDDIKGSAEEAAAKALAESVGAISFESVEEKPAFNGGNANDFSNWVNSQIKYPAAAVDKGVQGRVVVGFVVDENGNVGNVRVIRGVDADLDAEAVRVVSASPKWAPGQQNGHPVKVSYIFPVRFQLQ